MLAHISNGKAVRIEGDKECRNSKGFLCAKGHASLDLLYHPDRLKHPMARVGGTKSDGRRLLASML